MHLIYLFLGNDNQFSKNRKIIQIIYYYNIIINDRCNEIKC